MSYYYVTKTAESQLKWNMDGSYLNFYIILAYLATFLLIMCDLSFGGNVKRFRTKIVAHMDYSEPNQTEPNHARLYWSSEASDAQVSCAATSHSPTGGATTLSLSSRERHIQTLAVLQGAPHSASRSSPGGTILRLSLSSRGRHKPLLPQVWLSRTLQRLSWRREDLQERLHLQNRQNLQN